MHSCVYGFFYLNLWTLKLNIMYKRVLLIFIFTLALLSCSTTKYIEKEVPVETIKTEYINNIKYDSIYVHDSTELYIKGDTVFKSKTKIYHKIEIQRDTVFKVDSIPYIIRNTETVVKEVNRLKWYQKVLNSIGLCSIICLFGYLYFKIK